MNNQSLRQKVILLLQIGFAIGMLFWLWQIVGGEQALLLLAGADPVWLIASFLVLTLQTVLSALRWKITAKELGIDLSVKLALSEYYLAQLVNQALPGGVIGDAGRAVRSRDEAGLLPSSQAVVFERLSGQAGLLLVLVAALGISMLLPGGVEWPSWILLTIIGITIVITLLIFGLSAISQKFTGALGRGLKSFGPAAQKVFFTPSSSWLHPVLSLSTAICNVAGFTFAAWAVGSSLGFSLALVLVPLILLAMLIPISVSGWGLREGVAVALFPMAGLVAVEGMAASVAFGLICLVVALPGLLFTRPPKSKDASSSETLERTT